MLPMTAIGLPLLCVFISEFLAMRGAFEAMIAGKLNATIECNPLLGPQLVDAIREVQAQRAEEGRFIEDRRAFHRREERVPVADAVAQLTSEYLDLVFETFPTVATVFGRHEHDGRLEELTAERLDDFTRRLGALRRPSPATAS